VVCWPVGYVPSSPPNAWSMSAWQLLLGFLKLQHGTQALFSLWPTPNFQGCVVTRLAAGTSLKPGMLQQPRCHWLGAARASRCRAVIPPGPLHAAVRSELGKHHGDRAHVLGAFPRWL